jgi:hypothetical protein
MPHGASIAMFSGMLGPATGSMMMSTPLPWVIFADALADHLALAIDGVIGTEIAGKARLLIAADHADHGEAGRLRQVDERIPHSACGCINEHALARSRPNGIVEDVIGDLVAPLRHRDRRCPAGQRSPPPASLHIPHNGRRDAVVRAHWCRRVDRACGTLRPARPL